ncbi:hypothetical protein TVAG_389840 [Trichomonas vaginalis G3]|uniref:Ankyrin repeat protein n=1 Tax=Trichomonas vaginalis (strain ATCC PRA-98 / G3) TaxID=412133 RepID=A2E186_TRIV3|nr:hypothetical protein TVAGG3_0939200 [Trichomonas vaginalis G3]EAY13587.1 hypothetical protein TVAG_389840 [Trichomonas vaginalis G3]KAI5486415.1 hypothetical protein TVAGG3_0939200 [Trichomonas vaginalis G3]|eukprot:XP_001325810.1 hypothetical protein [Trichomonas vaginalis G3]
MNNSKETFELLISHGANIEMEDINSIVHILTTDRIF